MGCEPSHYITNSLSDSLLHSEGYVIPISARLIPERINIKKAVPLGWPVSWWLNYFSTIDFYSGERTEAAGESEWASVAYAKNYLALSVAA